MSTSWLDPTDGRAVAREAETAAEQRAVLAEAAAAATLRAGEAVLALQKADGYWCGDLLADTTLESDYVLLQLWLYPPEAGVWRPPTGGRIEKTRAAYSANSAP